MEAALSGIGLTAPMYAAAGLLCAVTLVFAVSIRDNESEQAAAQKHTLSFLDRRIRFPLIGFFLQDQLTLPLAKTAQVVGAGMAIAGVMVVAVQIVMTKLLKWDFERLLRVGLPLLAAGFVGFLAVPHHYLLDFIALGLGIGCTLLGYTTTASLSVKESEQDSVASFLASIQGVVLGTYLYTLHVVVPYGVCGVLLAWTLPFVYRKKKEIASSAI